MADDTHHLSIDEQNRVLKQVYRRLWESDANLFRQGEPWRPAGACALQQHIALLIEVARDKRESADLVLHRACASCAHRTPCGFCPFVDHCVLRAQMPSIIDAVYNACHNGSR